MNSPFIYGKIASGATFTDRETEQKRLSDDIASHINSILISPRRWGKSSLVAKVGQTLRQRSPSLRFCFLDLFNVRSEQEFYAQLTKEVLRVSFSNMKQIPCLNGYRIVGDVHFSFASQVAGAITPVPGGVGPMTIAMLMRNTLIAAEGEIYA